jgi:asparagine synthase (glutamine-hydrolysing)
MCGITAIWERGSTFLCPDLSAQIREMTATLEHRGPDAGAVWVDQSSRVALGHRRLSIVDLSVAGAQPMHSSCGRFVISYNGEVYNSEELRSELKEKGRQFRGYSDTEIIVEGAAVWGVVPTIQRLIGMFAILLWDRRERVLYAIRDRLGIKPIYWAELNGRLIFGSELKALRADRHWQPELDRAALAAYMRFGYVPAPLTIYKNVKKLPPASVLIARENYSPRLERYWSLDQVAQKGQGARFAGGEDEAAEALDTLLRDAVKRRMVADVPLGAFLSGGIDSSTVVALMQAEHSRAIKTFSIGFHEQSYDEAANAAAVARHLGTEHTELYASPRDALDVIPRLPEMFDEPFADSSQIPTYLVSRMTREHVTVALSGDGGDEVFGGYTRYFRGEALWRAIDSCPRSLRTLAATSVRTLRPSTWDVLGRLLPEQHRPAQFGAKMHKLAGVFEGEPEASAFYQNTVSLWLQPELIVRDGVEPLGPHQDVQIRQLVPDFIERMQYLDTLTYLPDDILTKVDRASMMVSLEARVPLLDHRIVEFSWSLPSKMKAGNGVGKRLLRKVLGRYVPRALTERPKMGFAMPVQAWLRGELRDWAEALLDERRLVSDGILNGETVRSKWLEHTNGTRNWHPQLWAVLMFQAWKERWLA